MCSGSLVLGNPGDMRSRSKEESGCAHTAATLLAGFFCGLCTAKNSAVRTAEDRPNQWSCFQRLYLGFLTYKVVFMNFLRKPLSIVDQGQMKFTSFISIVL